MLLLAEPANAADDRVQPGALLKPNIRLSHPLADGGMGCVWVAEHLGLGAPVAVKFLHGALARNPEAVSRFRREAASAARIRSPHVVQILDYDVTSSGVPYIVMELLEGETLGARLARRGRLGCEETLSLVKQVARALARAHELGIVHRDIKPENIFLVRDDEEPFAKILDFGVAKDLTVSGSMSSGAVVGTPQFMAPEQMAGMDVGAGADVWALGVVAYACITGRLPFASETFYGMAAAIEKGVQLLPISHFDADVPPSIDAWLVQALEPDPRRRFANARAMLEAIERMTHRPLSDFRMRSAPPRPEPAGRTLPPTVRIDKRRLSRRVRRVAGLLAQVLLATFFGLLFVTGIGLRARMVAMSSPSLVVGASDIGRTFRPVTGSGQHAPAAAPTEDAERVPGVSMIESP